MKKDLVLMNPSAMQLCGFHIGGLCVVNKTSIRTCWPCGRVGLASVAVSDNVQGVQQGQLLTVEPFIDPLQHAVEVYLTSGECSPFFKDDNFLHYMSRSNENKYICEGCKTNIMYYGQKFEFLVTKILGLSLPTQNFQVSSPKVVDKSDSLLDSIADLSICDSSQTHSKSLLDDSSCEQCDSRSSEDITSTPCFSKKYLSVSENSEGSLKQCSETDISLEKLTTPVRDKNSSADIISSPKTPVSERSFSARDNFCTPKVEKIVDQCISQNFYKVTSKTKIVIPDVSNAAKDGSVEVKKQRIGYSDIGGMSKQIEMLKEMVHTPIEQPELFKSFGLPPPSGVLLFGPSGCGKSMLVKAVVSEINISVVNVSGSEIWSKFYGETETKLKNIFDDARCRAPSVIVIDDVETLCPRRDSSHSEVEKRVVACLLTQMDGINNVESEKFVVVLGTTSKPDQIDPALRRPGRFDREIEIGVPSVLDRRDILQCMLRKLSHALSTIEIQEVADAAHGYVGADLAALCKEASLHCMKHQDHASERVSLTLGDFKHAMTMVQPSAMREVQLEVPKVLWSDIGGQEHIKLKLKQAVEWPLKHPEAFTRMGISPPRGILMYGPPGCSKTMIAKALATESGLNFLAVKGPELFSKWVGESERAVREVFRKARAASPAIIFFDEIDALAIERGSSSGSSNVADRVLAQLLTEIDGVETLKDVTIVAATNRPDMIDKALLRPGRFDRVLYVPLPDLPTRAEIFRINLSKMPVDTDCTASWLADCTSGYSGAEISSVCHEAALFALQEDITSQVVKKSHFNQALQVVTPRINDSLIKFYDEYQQKSGLHTI
ncbi:ribosome biogenesis protein SPATA5-like isoform X2 [Mercenaria mercenaria]|nr:ribosome biogenesis protein SPATA5-like isoform X2 [Mercenaria mercenaria]